MQLVLYITVRGEREEGPELIAHHWVITAFGRIEFAEQFVELQVIVRLLELAQRYLINLRYGSERGPEG